MNIIKNSKPVISIDNQKLVKFHGKLKGENCWKGRKIVQDQGCPLGDPGFSTQRWF